MVLSGEHVGGGTFWGHGGRGALQVSDIAALAAAFPRTARAIEDLHTSACNSAVEIRAWPKIFPGLKTVWAYAGTCPGAFTGASSHLALWDRATRGHSKSIDRLLARRSRMGNHVVVWSAAQGIATGEVNSLDDLRSRLLADRQVFESHFNGDSVVTDTGAGPLRDYYELLQATLRHIDLPEAERSTFEKRRDQTIRLIFYDKSIKGAFARAFAAQSSSGYTALRMSPPDFSRLSRKEALASIAAFTEKADTTRADLAEALRPILIEGLQELSDRYVPVSWI